MKKTSEKEFEKHIKLMEHIYKEKYKNLCDLIKVKVLDRLIELINEKKGKAISKQQLIFIRKGIDNLRKKETQEEKKIILKIIRNIINRGEK